MFYVSCFTENIEVSQCVKLSRESVCKTESFDSLFVREMTHLPSVSSHGQKMSQVTQFHIVTHFDVFCVSSCKKEPLKLFYDLHLPGMIGMSLIYKSWSAKVYYKSQILERSSIGPLGLMH